MGTGLPLRNHVYDHMTLVCIGSHSIPRICTYYLPNKILDSHKLHGEEEDRSLSSLGSIGESM